MTDHAEDQWATDHDTVFAVAQHAVNEGELRTAQDVLDFMERPWHYPELHQLWLDNNGGTA